MPSSASTRSADRLIFATPTARKSYARILQSGLVGRVHILCQQGGRKERDLRLRSKRERRAARDVRYFHAIRQHRRLSCGNIFGGGARRVKQLERAARNSLSGDSAASDLLAGVEVDGAVIAGCFKRKDGRGYAGCPSTRRTRGTLPLP